LTVVNFLNLSHQQLATWHDLFLGKLIFLDSASVALA
jgi:hypothetical protein